MTTMAFKFLKGLRGQKNNANHKPSADELINEFSWLGDSLMLSFSSQSLDEIIEFKTKPVQQETVRLIQEHFGRLAFIYMHYMRGAGANNRSYMYRTELTLYGENGYATSDPVEFMSGIMHDLPGADGFRILSYYYGKCPQSEQYEPFTGTIEKIGGYERFSYSRHERLDLHQHSVARFENGQWVGIYADIKVEEDPVYAEEGPGPVLYCTAVNPCEPAVPEVATF